jgi:type II secretory ATPase GspE/PulE/Tfp pilus assembly ATPase PilB-like protein
MLAERFMWPAPPNHAFADENTPTVPEGCVIVYAKNNTKVLGQLHGFSPDEGIAEFRQTGRDALVQLDFDEIKEIRLTRPVSLRKVATLLEKTGIEVFQSSESQKYTLHYSDGQIATGITHGSFARESGLFLFIENDSGNVIRSFNPKHAVKNIQIGAALGKMLVENKIVSKEKIEEGLEKQDALRMQRIGDYMTANQIVMPDQLVAALACQISQPNLRLGDAMLQLKLITEAQLRDALGKQKENRKKALGEILIDMGLVDKNTIREVLAKQLGIPIVDLHKFNIASDVVKMLSADIVRRRHVVPLLKSNDRLVVAMENPMDMALIDEIRFSTGLKPLPVFASFDDIQYAIKEFYDSGSGTTDGSIDKLAQQLATDVAASEEPEDTVADSDSTLVRLVNKMILDASRQNASDIHIECRPGKEKTIIRLRKDGSLSPYLEVPPGYRRALVSRIKVMCNMDISEHRKPQDGKLDFARFGPDKIELRVVTVPTTDGLEDVVLRVLTGADPIPIDKLEFEDDILEQVKRIADRPHGLFLVCGPTGSGKTTTLHSVISYVNKPDTKIWTAEDPIEIRQDGIRQVQMNPKFDWTFAAAMRTFLRADPDIIMVGEMRDQETAKIGIEASLTGHLVFSTLHTNSAPESLVRLLDLGMDPYNFSDALHGVLAQRLVKRLCVKCRTGGLASDSDIEELAFEYGASDAERGELVAGWRSRFANAEGLFLLYTPSGCRHCDNTGYRGRIGVHELLVATPAIKKLIQRRATVAELVETAQKEGMRSLKQDGVFKVLQGHVDLRQVRAVC